MPPDHPAVHLAGLSEPMLATPLFVGRQGQLDRHRLLGASEDESTADGVAGDLDPNLDWVHLRPPCFVPDSFWEGFVSTEPPYVRLVRIESMPNTVK